MRPHSIVRTLAAAALLLIPTVALAEPDQNTRNYPNNGNNGCPSGQWRNQYGQCGVWNNNGQYNNGQYNNGRHRHHDRDDNNGNGRDRDDRDDHGNRGHHYGWNNPNNPHNGGYNNGGYNNGGYYGNGGYGNRGNQLSGTVSSFSPYNLYLSNGTHVELHDGTVINPRGTNLTGGQRVRIIGNWNSDGTFNANEIDVIGSGYRY